ncbi:AfsR/SARP family transcriptional regulator [Micromonospora tulbaghiae]|uniref:AfsR/SARP family transcriptional regulator n=1 Tax=Micromonospora tulbaghiae TaxID=479978 RepID=UPI003EBA05FF
MQKPDATGMRIRVLGPLSLTNHDTSITPTAPKPRSVLALLLIHAGHAVSAAALFYELWGDEPPHSAATTLQTYVLHLRRLLSTGLGTDPATIATTVLMTTPGGYLLNPATDDFDLHRYQRLTTAGRQALAYGDNTRAADLLQDAQSQWSGPAFTGVHAEALLRPQIKRLEESRLTTIEQSIEARLRLGRHQEVLPELAGMLAEHPHHENLHAQLMIALHRSGRRHDALQAFQRLRAALTTELGLEPCLRLRMLHQAILADDPALQVPPRDDGLAQTIDNLAVR